MDNIEQLKQDNEKLNARLAKAVEVFKEQKANIEKLTKENEELKDQINRTPHEEVISTEKWNALATEKENLEKTIESKDNAYKTLQDTYNEVFAENTKLKNELQDVSSNKAESDSIAITAKEKISNLENEIINLKKTIDINTDETKKLVNDYENKITRLEEDNIKLGENGKLLEDAKLDYDKLQREHNALMETYNKINNEYSDIYTKYNDLEQGRIKSEEQLNSLNNLCIQMKEDIKEKKDIIEDCYLKIDKRDTEIIKLKEDLEKTKKICDNFENEKLSWEADYQAELNAYKELQDAYEILRNERDVYSKSDDVLAEIIKVLIDNGLTGKTDITPNTPIKEDGKMHRMGSNLEGGKNIGV